MGRHSLKLSSRKSYTSRYSTILPRWDILRTSPPKLNKPQGTHQASFSPADIDSLRSVSWRLIIGETRCKTSLKVVALILKKIWYELSSLKRNSWSNWWWAPCCCLLRIHSLVHIFYLLCLDIAITLTIIPHNYTYHQATVVSHFCLVLHATWLKYSALCSAFNMLIATSCYQHVDWIVE